MGPSLLASRGCIALVAIGVSCERREVVEAAVKVHGPETKNGLRDRVTIVDIGEAAKDVDIDRRHDLMYAAVGHREAAHPARMPTAKNRIIGVVAVTFGYDRFGWRSGQREDQPNDVGLAKLCPLRFFVESWIVDKPPVGAAVVLPLHWLTVVGQRSILDPYWELPEMTVWRASGGSQKVFVLGFLKRTINYRCFTT
jgi:hypothetical protein